MSTMNLLFRRLDVAPDPLQVYQAVSAEQASPSGLFETADIAGGASTQSLIFIDPLMSVTARGYEVTLKPYHESGTALIEGMLARLPDRIAVRRQAKEVILTFPPLPNDVDQESRLRSLSVFAALRRLLEQLQFSEERARSHAFLYGCFAYDLLGSFEQLPQAEKDPTAYPDFSFHLAGAVAVIDHRHAATSLYALAPADDAILAQRRIRHLERVCRQAQRSTETDGIESEPSTASRAAVETSDSQFADLVLELKRYIDSGDVYQIVPSRSFTAPCADPLKAYAKLRQLNPSPYMFYLSEPGSVLFGASPESALKVDAPNRRVEIRPIAGTRRRGRDPAGQFDHELDTRLELELRLSEKELAEHAMLVDLARNDVARVAKTGSRRVSELMHIERYSHVMHLVSRVEGTLRDGLDALSAYQATLNMGTLTGAPKLRAAELLRTYEPARRGPYGGAVGYLTARGDLDTCIVIRSALVQNGVARVQAGAGIVADSDPWAEADETRRKAQAVLTALGAKEVQDD